MRKACLVAIVIAVTYWLAPAPKAAVTDCGGLCTDCSWLNLWCALTPSPAPSFKW